MVYVMMSRCCALDQLHIVDKFDPQKITVDGDVKTEVTRMDKVSVNRNPNGWTQLHWALKCVLSTHCLSASTWKTSELTLCC